MFYGACYNKIEGSDYTGIQEPFSKQYSAIKNKVYGITFGRETVMRIKFDYEHYVWRSAQLYGHDRHATSSRYKQHGTDPRKTKEKHDLKPHATSEEQCYGIIFKMLGIPFSSIYFK